MSRKSKTRAQTHRVTGENSSTNVDEIDSLLMLIHNQSTNDFFSVPSVPTPCGSVLFLILISVKKEEERAEGRKGERSVARAKVMGDSRTIFAVLAVLNIPHSVRVRSSHLSITH